MDRIEVEVVSSNGDNLPIRKVSGSEKDARTCKIIYTIHTPLAPFRHKALQNTLKRHRSALQITH